MDQKTADTLREGTLVRHKHRGGGVWRGVDQWENGTCWVEFPGEGPVDCVVDKVEVR